MLNNLTELVETLRFCDCFKILNVVFNIKELFIVILLNRVQILVFMGDLPFGK